MCRVMSRALADHVHARGSHVVYLVIHGYSVDNHADAVAALDPDPDHIVLGTSTPSTAHDGMYAALQATFPHAYSCASNWDGDAFGLCGDTDEVYRDLLASGDVALHPEIETALRASDVIAAPSTAIADSFAAALM